MHALRLTAVAIAVLCLTALATAADARPQNKKQQITSQITTQDLSARRHYRRHIKRYRTHTARIRATEKPTHAFYGGPGYPGGPTYGYATTDSRYENRTRTARRLSSDSSVVGGRQPGDPRAYCGAEAVRYIYRVAASAKRDLWLAANWIRKFPRTQPAPGMAAARRGHVMVLISHQGGNNWLVHDGNSGRGMTREHVRSIAGFVVVNPHATRTASR